MTDKIQESVSTAQAPEAELEAKEGVEPSERKGMPEAELSRAGSAPDGAEEPNAAEQGGQVGQVGEEESLTEPVERTVEDLYQELAAVQDKNLRLHAEFENYKRRMHKEQGEVLKYSQLPLLRDLTGIMDNLERAIDHARKSENPDHDVFVQGLEMVTKQIGGVFERYGMIQIKAKGSPFDPTLHEAMNLVETDTVPENTVVEEFQVGYVLHDRIVRPSMVSVSKSAAGGASVADDSSKFATPGPNVTGSDEG